MNISHPPTYRVFSRSPGSETGLQGPFLFPQTGPACASRGRRCSGREVKGPRPCPVTTGRCSAGRFSAGWWSFRLRLFFPPEPRRFGWNCSMFGGGGKSEALRPEDQSLAQEMVASTSPKELGSPTYVRSAGKMIVQVRMLRCGESVWILGDGSIT